jgi:hypothetical protein
MQKLIQEMTRDLFAKETLKDGERFRKAEARVEKF